MGSTKLAAIIANERGAGDVFLAGLAKELAAMGYRLGGVVQDNGPDAVGCKGDMNLIELTSGKATRISQDLGDQSKGCRLDSSALEEVAGLINASVGQDLDLVILNKFGKREAEGAGLRQPLLKFVEAGIPVLVSVGSNNLDAWQEFCGDMSEILPADKQAVLDWLA